MVGALVWIVTVGLLKPGWAVVLFLFAPLVLVPLGLGLLSAPDRARRYPRVWQALIWLQLPAALLLAVAFALGSGWFAALLALPWLAVTSLGAALGAIHFAHRRVRSAEDFCEAAALVYLPIGAGWCVLSRRGARPLSFSDLIVLATAVHFHYAGFVLPLLSGFLIRVLQNRAAQFAAVGVVVAVPLVAVGITLSAFHFRLLEWLAAWFLAGACFLVAALQLRIAALATGIPRWLLILSGLSLLLAMVLAAAYALGEYWHASLLRVEDMLPFHGAVNAFGFALSGLLAASLLAGRKLSS
jgi:hypothetical protein